MMGLVLLILMAGSAAAAVFFTRKPATAPADVTAFGSTTGTAPTASTPPGPLPTPPVVGGGSPPTPATSTAATPPATSPPPGRTPPVSRGTHTAKTATPSPPPAPESLGYLTFDTYPWTRVSEGASSLGTTPLVHVALPAGSHTFTLDNPDQSIHQTYSITIKAGDSVTKHLGLK
jgi:hypothetical protein